MWYNKGNGDASIISMATKSAKNTDAKKSDDKLLGKYLKFLLSHGSTPSKTTIKHGKITGNSIAISARSAITPELSRPSCLW